MRTLLCLSLLGACTLASAQSMRPGLWETQFTMKSQSGQMEQAMRQAQQEMANLPPEQRKMIEQMMAQNGVAMGGPGGMGASSIKVCISKEQAERLDMPQRDSQCIQEIVQRSASGMKIRFSCAGNPPTTGEGEISFVSATAYSGRMVVNTQVQGKPERMNMDQTGKWLGEDCGALKPVKR